MHANPVQQVRLLKSISTRNRKHRRVAAKPAACTKPLMLSTLRRKGKRKGRREGRWKEGRKEEEKGMGEEGRERGSVGRLSWR